MKNEFIPYEEALALKELGFEEKCLGYYYNGDYFLGTANSLSYKEILGNNAILTPLYQQAFRWFREKYNLHAIFEHDSDNYYYVIQGVNDFDFTTIDGSEENELYLIHKEAELACLRKLIEILNQNKDEKDN
jgi:hypothetical protein